MSEADITVLLAFLAAAITLAGLSGLIVSIDRQASVASSSVITFRMQSLIRSAGVLGALSLLPIVLAAFDLDIRSVWRFANITAAFLSALTLVPALAMVRRFVGKEGRGFSWSVLAINTAALLTAVIAAVLGAIELAPPRGAYFLSLSASLFVVFVLFHRILDMAHRSHQATEAEESAPKDPPTNSTPIQPPP